MSASLILVEFKDVHDKNQVVKDGPWNFDRSLILVKEFDENQQVKNI